MVAVEMDGDEPIWEKKKKNEVEMAALADRLDVGIKGKGHIKHTC